MNLLMHYNYTDHLSVSECECTPALSQLQTLLIDQFALQRQRRTMDRIYWPRCFGCIISTSSSTSATYSVFTVVFFRLRWRVSSLIIRANCKKKMRKPYACFVDPHNITFSFLFCAYDADANCNNNNNGAWHTVLDISFESVRQLHIQWVQSRAHHLVDDLDIDIINNIATRWALVIIWMQ